MVALFLISIKTECQCGKSSKQIGVVAYTIECYTYIFLGEG